MAPGHPSIAARALAQLRGAGPSTVTDLARSLDVSRTSVEKALIALEASGIVVAGPDFAAKGAGRPARSYAFHASAGSAVGIDIGIGSVRVLLADLDGRVAVQREFPGVQDHEDGAAKLAAVFDRVHETLAAAPRLASSILAAGVSLPGIVDDGGRVTASVVIPEWSGVDVGAQLTQTLGCPVSVDNGVRLAAVAEHHLGVAQFVDDLLYISVGNRIAMGLILDGEPRRGIHNAAGDIGRLAFRSIVGETGQIVWRTAPTAAEVFERAGAGDDAARAELDAFIDQLSQGIATLAMTVDPAMIVIGGGLSEAHEDLLGPLRSALQQHIDLPFRIPLVAARLGAAAAAHGALVHAFQEHSSHIYGLDGMPTPQITILDTTATVPSREDQHGL
ncbi:putative NBD/HSP70 family sugar kinase [Microbacterium sp. W4I4]|uniref:ROK family transcriptional regulator n=1 Tax=Microbacterium sp. W4I4 TaxID=3042295 RepID=UPI0027842732|nr:ROK family transcriptional regulator [Microbacterium sp. W4I4]MDQ0614493.1 putative NBD/HSP70 family sugar kinase [Microbacterium sp. W4I4]